MSVAAHARANSEPQAPTGLSSAAASAALETLGPNALPPPKTSPLWRRLARQLFHFFAILLWVAAALSVVAGMVSLGIAIALVVVLNGLFSFAQEYRAERAAHKLMDLLPSHAVVRRDGRWIEVDSRVLVPQDVLSLSAGDRISADLELLRGGSLMIDTSMLTGESVPCSLAEGDRAFAGSFVVEGEALAVVRETGARTRLASIAELTRSRERPATPLAHELDRLVRVISVIALAIGLAFLAVGSLVGLPLRDGFLLAIGVAVALVPEGLLPTVTLSLALGASRMAQRSALVRRLEAVATLGSTTFICTDKTGTLTANQMNVVEVWTPAGRGAVHGHGYEPTAQLELDSSVRDAARRLALAATRCSSGRALERNGEWVARGDPMEAALHVLALRLQLDLEKDEARRPILAKFAFDPRRRRMSVRVADDVYVKGAADAVLPLCHADSAASVAASEMAERGLRVIAVASRRMPDADTPRAAEDLEHDLELLGLVGLLDPPRPEVRQALAKCHRAGLRIAILTGDHAGTARAVAHAVGLNADLVIEGTDLPDDEVALGALIDRDGTVVCRVTPEQKLRVAKALQARGHVIAMTGDGVNDGPVLHQADIGIAMGRSGTDVAREAADLVLLDDQFETIVYAIEQGRATFSNIRRFLTYHLTDNVAELTPFAIWALSAGRFPLALSVLQILCLDLLTDQLPALALGAEPASPRALEGPPPGKHIVDAKLLVRAFAVLGSTESVLEMAAFAAVLWASGWRPSGAPPSAMVLLSASGAAFLAIVAGQSANALGCRSSSRPAWSVPLRSNPAVLAAILSSSTIACLLTYVPAFARILGHGAPTGLGLASAALAFPVVLLVDALHKRWR